MALRVRKNGRILCAAKSPALEGDIYIDDGVHCWLTRCLPISINVIDSLDGEDENGEEEWHVIQKNKDLIYCKDCRNSNPSAYDGYVLCTMFYIAMPNALYCGYGKPKGEK